MRKRKCSMMADSSEKMYCVPCCAKCEDKCFCEDTALHVQILNREPHARVAFVRAADKTSYGTLREKNHVCGNVTLCAGLVSCVHSRRCKGIAIACKRKHLESVLKKIAHSMMRISTMKLLANLRMKNLLMDGRTTSIPFWVDTRGTLFTLYTLLTSSLSNLILGVSLVLPFPCSSYSLS